MIAGVLSLVTGRIAFGGAQIVLGLIVLFLLYNRRAAVFFATN
jgi:hypothetical protein